jgi:hypothetical protein
VESGLQKSNERLIVGADFYLVKYLDNGKCRHDPQQHDTPRTIQVETLVADLWDAWRNALRTKLTHISASDPVRNDLKFIVAIADRVG